MTSNLAGLTPSENVTLYENDTFENKALPLGYLYIPAYICCMKSNRNIEPVCPDGARIPQY